VGHLQAALAAQGCLVVVADDGEATDDLVRDMTEVLMSRCACMYCRRGALSRYAGGDGCRTGVANCRGEVRRVGAV
jgi:predicted site-specific integrase-resolvase